MNKVIIYVDGACKGNPGRGGYGVLLSYKGKTKELFGSENNTTNNKMELLAVIKGLEQLKRPCEVVIYSDSNYVVKGINEWMKGWIRNNWKSSTGKEVKNVELWKRLNELLKIHNVEFNWVKGHSGNDGNEIADRLANKGCYSE